MKTFLSKIAMCGLLFTLFGNIGVVSAQHDALEKALLDRFLRYVKVRAVSSYDSLITPGQLRMADMLYEEARQWKGVEARTEEGYVYLHLPSNVKRKLPRILFSAHLDTTPEVLAPAEGFEPNVIVSYDGKPIVLDSGGRRTVIDPAEETHLQECVGRTIITSHGDTYLGGDCRTGVSILMELVHRLSADPGIAHGDVYVLLCPNEDVGRAADGVKWQGEVPDLIYDFDAQGLDMIDNNFTACGYTVRFVGNQTHPSDAADNGYADAWNAAARFVAGIPVQTHPEKSRGRSGYIHPFSMKSPDDGTTVEVGVRLRYFSPEEGALLKRLVEESLRGVGRTNPRVQVDSRYKEEYVNVAESMHPRCVEYALAAYRACGFTDVNRISLRAGVTAAMFPLHTPFPGGVCLGSGQHREHSFSEYADLTQMADACRIALQIVREAAR